MRYAVVTSGWKTAIVGVIRAKTSSGEEWQAQRVPVCRALGHPTNGSKASEQLAAQLDETGKRWHHVLIAIPPWTSAMKVNILR